MEGKPYKINGNWDETESVLKLFYGPKKYVVVKAKNQMQALQAIEKTIAAHIRGGEPNPASLYYHLVVYIKKNPGKIITIEKVLVNNPTKEDEPVYTGLDFLKAEQIALDEGRQSKNCLNNNTVAYIPQYNEDTQSYSWISRADVLNFKKWFKTRPSRLQARKKRAG